MKLLARPAFVALVTLSVTGCQTASLEDAAPKAATANAFDAASVPAASADQTVSDAGGTAAPQPQVIRRNPGVTSFIPIEKATPVENKDFVATGARRSGQYLKIGHQPTVAHTQFSDADKLAAEAEMTELLRARASTPDARRQYEARLKQLRALATNHGADTQQEIEN